MTEDDWDESLRWPVPPNLVTIGGYISLSSQLARELHEQRIGPLHGPPIPTALASRRALGGHPVGPYRKADA